MSNVRLAMIDEASIVQTVIVAPPGSGPDFPGEVLGLAGIWVPDPFVQAGPGSLFVEETGEFYALDLDPHAEPAEPEETP
jgi:hypothetical protein